MLHSAEEILDAFEQAVNIAKRLPWDGPVGIRNRWPAILRQGHEGYCRNDRSLGAPTAKEIEEFEKVASWIRFIPDASTRCMVWSYASGKPGWKIGKAAQPPISQSSVSRRIVSALALIAFRVNAGESPPEIRIPEISLST